MDAIFIIIWGIVYSPKDLWRIEAYGETETKEAEQDIKSPERMILNKSVEAENKPIPNKGRNIDVIVEEDEKEDSVEKEDS